MKYFILQIDGIEGLYTYRDKDDEYNIGEQVIVRFANRKVSGLILARDKRTEFDFKVNNILERLEGEVVIPLNLIKLFWWMKDYYVASMRHILTTAYPQNLKVRYSKRCSLAHEYIGATKEEEDIKEYLKKKKKEITYQTLCKNFGKETVDKLIKEKKVNLVKRVIRKEDKTLVEEGREEAYHKEATLTPEQDECKRRITEGEKTFYLLKGITGSGKTEVYIKLIKDALSRGEGTIFMVPEISLTPQMIKRIKRDFGDNIALLHSKLTPAERGQEWLSIYNGEKQVVLGVRSAVFAPVKNLKYIIIDEEHENSYKQDSNPRYDARYVAFRRASLEGLKVVLGSATPSIESYHYAKEGIFELLEMKSRYSNATLPELKLVDMKKSNSIELSRELLEDTAARLRRGEQILYLLNRKGYSTFIQCKECGHTEECPHCSVTMNYYKKEGRYRCNYCGYSKPFSKFCSNCKSDELIFSGQGTEKLEDKILEYFPKARVLRVDAETVKARDAYERIYEDFLSGKYDIIMGTQIISKGLHFPGITLVGIVTADTILHFPDFRAAEKTFQLVYQAAGRAGRGDKKGEVLIQTYNSDHYVIDKILKNDYEGLYDIEIENRRMLKYPPFGRIINIVLSSLDEEYLKVEAKKFRKEIGIDGIEIFGPMPCAISRIKNRYRYQIFVKGNRKKLGEFKKGLYEKIQRAKTDKLRITIDVDPINLM